MLTLWGYVGSEMRRLPVDVDFDADARVETVCLEPDAYVPRPQRTSVGRGMRALGSMRHTPQCLAGRRLSLADAWRDQAQHARRERSRGDEPAHRCSIRDPGCEGWSPPVCAQRTDGRWADYRDHCEACRDPSVVGWTDRICALR